MTPSGTLITGRGSQLFVIVIVYFLSADRLFGRSLWESLFGQGLFGRSLRGVSLDKVSLGETLWDSLFGITSSYLRVESATMIF